MTPDEISAKARVLFDAKRQTLRQAGQVSVHVDPPGMATTSGKLTKEWLEWTNQAALEAVAEDEGVAVDELMNDAVEQTFSNPLHQKLAEHLRRLNPSLFQRLEQAKALAPFVVWLVHQRDLRAMELRGSNMIDAESQASLDVYGPFLPGPDEDEAAWFRELEENAEQEGLEMLARWSQQDLGKDQTTLDDEEDERLANLRARADDENRTGQS